EFEERIYVKDAEPATLLADLRRARDGGREIAIGTATDPYQPAEGRFNVTRSVLEAMARVPGLRVGVTTKSTLVAPDADLLREIARLSVVGVTLPVFARAAVRPGPSGPRPPGPALRLRAMRSLADAGTRTRLFVMPVLPLITDGAGALGELLRAARGAG